MSNKDDKIFNKGKRSEHILYRVRRSTSARNEIIPESEKKPTDNEKLADLASSIADTVKKPFEKIEENISSNSYPTRSDRYTSGNTRTIRKTNPFDTKIILITLLICGIIAACTFIFIPLAFASETHTVHMNDSGREFTAETSAKTVGEFLEKNGITVGDYDLLEMSPDTEISDDMNIIIRRAMDLTVNTMDDSLHITMLAGTVGDALEMAQIEMQEGDEVYPDINTYVRDGMTIDYIKVEIEYTTETQAVGFKNLTQETDDLFKGETKLAQEGKEGEKEITYKKIYKNGTLFSTSVDSEKITVEPINEITLIGTKEKPAPVEKKKSASNKQSKNNSDSKKNQSEGKKSSDDAKISGDDTIEINGKTYNVKAIYNSKVTAYCSHCDPSGVGASGQPLSYGSLAAGSMFSFGTKIYVPGYGIGYVVDRGGGMTGTRIDVYMGTHDNEEACNSWGVKNLQIYVLE